MHDKGIVAQMVMVAVAVREEQAWKNGWSEKGAEDMSCLCGCMKDS